MSGLARRSAKREGGWRSHTVRVQLTLWYVVAMVLVLSVYIAVVYAFVSRNASRSLDQELRREFQWAAATIDVDESGHVYTRMEPQITYGDEELPWIQLWTGDGRLRLYMSDEAVRSSVPGSTQLTDFPEDDRMVFQSFAIAGQSGNIRLATRRFQIRDQPYILQVGRSEDAMRQDLRQLVAILAFGFPIAIAVAGLGGYALARRALRPIERMTDRAQHITVERLSDRLPVHNPDDEMGRLATVFNDTLARLEESFEQMRRFTADVSHELRTPLTAIRSVGEVGLRGQRDGAAYRGIIGSMLEEADRLASLVDRLLTISRAQTGQDTPLREDIDLESMVSDVVHHLEVLAEEKGQTLTLAASDTPHALADRVVLRQALINLVDNAIKFTPPGGRITVKVETPGAVTIDVIDSGPGVPPEASARIFDRFYRATAHATGSGLGLSIARGTLERTGGRLTLESTGPAGSTFRITVPRSTPPNVQSTNPNDKIA
ncbi:MAG TPA: ATP-binding protein [Vicinamibacterales bacterium]|nr:ATP-binding protein [Vicinamibacterales bacterium]